MKNLTATFLIASALSLIGACGQEGQEDSFEFTEEAGTDESAIMAVEGMGMDDGNSCDVNYPPAGSSMKKGTYEDGTVLSTRLLNTRGEPSCLEASYTCSNGSWSISTSRKYC
jgi:hypothetical protein